LSEIRQSASGELIAQYNYSEAGKLERKTLGNGAYTVYQYNGPNQQLSEVRNFLPGGQESTYFIYEYDKRGRITTMTTESGVWTYSYDSASQLVKWVTPEGDATEYTYDSRGNRLVQTRNGRKEGYSANSVNQYLTFNETENFVFDANGHLRQKTVQGSTERFTFDAEGKLIETETPDKR
jgi:YD repeat-containing protein